MSAPGLLRLRRVEVDGLFDTWNHRIALNPEDRVTLLHGPNGVGKTVILRMVNALLRKRFDLFGTIPFARFRLVFEGGSTLEMTAPGTENGTGDDYQLTLSGQGSLRTGKVRPPVNRARSMAARRHGLVPHQATAGQWMDRRSGEVLSSADAVSRFRGSALAEDSPDDDLSWFDEFLPDANAHLVEAQRPVRRDGNPKPGYPPGRRGPQGIPTSTVLPRARDFRKRLEHATARYGRRSQRLDQAFPRRLLEATDVLDEAELRETLTNLDRQRSDLKRIGLLDGAPTPRSRPKTFATWTGPAPGHDAPCPGYGKQAPTP